MYAEDALLPISALQHLAFCPRQCALIHIEQAWNENRLTAEGRLMHERVHEQEGESRGDVRIARGLKLRSLQLGLSGIADVVEFHRAGDGQSGWTPFPVEYKRRKPKSDDCDRVQLCAQALCLEEMLAARIPAGALFYGAVRRREDVLFTDGLREQTARTARSLHELVGTGITPPAVYEKKCNNCSLIDQCMPALSGHGSPVRYLHRMLEAAKP